MEVSSEIAKGLAIIADAKIIPDQQFNQLVTITFEILLKQKTEDALAGLSKAIDTFFLKQAYASLISAITSAASHNADPFALKGKLEENRVPEARREVIEKEYEKHKDKLRRLVQTTGFNLPHVVGVNWRLDYYVKNNRMDRVNIPVYFVTLKTEEGNGTVRDINIMCSVEQLQDLVTKLKSAVKQVDRILGHT